MLAEARVAGRPDEGIYEAPWNCRPGPGRGRGPPDHYSVLVGQRADFLAFHVIAEELRRLVSGQPPHPGPIAFRSPWMELERDRAELFQRFPSLRMGEPSAPAAAALPDPGSGAEGQGLSDLHPAVGTQVVSASLSLVTSHPQESCLFGFLRNAGIAMARRARGMRAPKPTSGPCSAPPG